VLDDAAVDDILQSLRETIAWCEPRVRTDEPEHCLRSEEIRPLAAATVYDSIGGDVRRVALTIGKRRAALESSAVSEIRAGDLRGGELIALDVDWQDASGASNVATAGYFDWNDTPPWDTWVAFVAGDDGRDYLLSWVPPAFVPMIGDAIDVNPMDALWEFGSRDELLEAALRERGLELGD
jgi:hypothetical protein